MRHRGWSTGRAANDRAPKGVRRTAKDRIPAPTLCLSGRLAPTDDPKEGTAVRFLNPLATFAALAGLGLSQLDPTVRAETLFLAPLAAAVLLCATLVSSGHHARTPHLLPWAAGLIVLAAWVIPAGATRGSAVALLLIATLVAVAGKLPGEARDLPFVTAFALTLGAQALMRSEIFLVPPASLAQILQFAFLPALAAFSIGLLARRHGIAGALTAGAFVVIAGGGWNLVPTLSLAAVAAGDLAAHRWPSKAEPNRSQTLGWGDLTPAFALALGVGVFVLRDSLSLTTAALLVIAFLASATLRHRPWLTTGVLVVVLAAGELRTAAEPGSEPVPWSLALTAVLLVPLLLPRLLLTSTRRWIPIALLALLTARHQEGAPMAAAALAALGIQTRDLPEARRGASVQRAWTGAWVAGSLFAAAYPWLRTDPLEAFLAAVGITGTGGRLGWAAAFLMASLGLVAAGSFRPKGSKLIGAGVLRSRVAGTRTVAGTGTVLLLLFISTTLAQKPGGQSLLPGEPVTLTAKLFRWTQALNPSDAEQLVLETNLAYAAALPAGQPVAAVRLHHADGTFTQRLVEAGRDTAEWAARRADVAPTLAMPPPAAWSSQVAAQGGFFAQRYRGVWDLEDSAPVTRISVLRHRDLPPEVMLTLFRVELIP